MVRNRTIATLGIAFLACAGFGVWALAATSPPGLAPESALNPGALDPTVDRPAVPVARDRGPSGNPLWGIPLRVLTATRERPLFSPSRRPPAPPVVAAPAAAPRPVAAPKPPEPERPPLTIVGTIVGDSESMAVFVEEGSNNVIRIRAGQDHDGWVLRSVHGREAFFEKDERKATLALPAPGATPSSTGVPGQPMLAGTSVPVQPTLPAPAARAPQAGNTWVDGDGNLIAPPSKLFQAAGRGN